MDLIVHCSCRGSAKRNTQVHGKCVLVGDAPRPEGSRADRPAILRAGKPNDAILSREGMFQNTRLVCPGLGLVPICEP